VPLGSLTAGASDLAWGDVDGDGDQDLALGSDGQTVIYRNDAGTLVPTEHGAAGLLGGQRPGRLRPALDQLGGLRQRRRPRSAAAVDLG
jgi:hypothetical protein